MVAGYNEDDCRATLALRDWLEERRLELAERLGEELPRPVAVDEPAAGARGSGGHQDQVRAARRRPRRRRRRTDEQKARALLADLLDWHRREDKPAWWRYFYLRTLSPAELIGEPDALGGLTGGEIVDRVKRVGGAAVLVPAAGAQVLGRAHGASTPRPTGAGRSGRSMTRPG